MKNTLLFTDCTNILVRLLTVTCPKNPKMCDPIIVYPVVKMRLHPLASYKEVPPPPHTHTHPDSAIGSVDIQFPSKKTGVYIRFPAKNKAFN